MGSHDTCAAGPASLERLLSRVSFDHQRRHHHHHHHHHRCNHHHHHHHHHDIQRGERTVKRRVHPSDINQQTDHGHVDRCHSIVQQLILEDPARLRTLGHGVNIDIRKGATRLGLVEVCEDGRLILEDGSQEIVLDVNTPQRNAIPLLDRPHLGARVEGGRGQILTGRRVVPGVGGIQLGRLRQAWPDVLASVILGRRTLIGLRFSVDRHLLIQLWLWRRTESILVTRCCRGSLG